MFNTITVEVDLEEYEYNVFDYAENHGYVKADNVVHRVEIQEVIDELEKDIYFYNVKTYKTLEDVVERLKELL